MCGTAPSDEASGQDAKLLKAAIENHFKKGSVKRKSLNKLQDNVCFSAAALCTFKVSKKRRIALSARSGLPDPRPKAHDTNIWSRLIESRRGYVYAARVLAKILGLFREAGSTSQTGPEQCSGLYQKGLWALFAAERENSYKTIENQFLCGRKLADGPPYDEPSIHKQDAHWLLKDAQELRYMVAVVNPHTALGMAIGQEIHDETCGSSPATAMARASRYFHFSPSAGSLFQSLQDACFKCRRLRMVRGRDLINPLRHLSHSNMVQGLQLQLDIAGPYLVFTKSKQYTGQLRGVKRTTTKMWLLLAIDYFTSRLEVLPLEDMSTGAVSSSKKSYHLQGGPQDGSGLIRDHHWSQQ